METPKMRRKTPRIAPLIALIVLFTIPLYFTSILDSSKKPSHANNNPFESSTKNTAIPCSAGTLHCRENVVGRAAGSGTQLVSDGAEKKTHVTEPDLVRESKCDLSTGEWVPNPGSPYYTNSTCYEIQEHQNCMKFGRPDLGFLKWRWKPDDCQLAVLDPRRFLELVRGKSMAFVGDSVARNHMQSLMCLLAKVGYPIDHSNPNDQNRLYEYKAYNFNISMFWTPFLVNTGPLDQEVITLYLDQFHEQWTTKIASFDFLVISAGHWFRRPTYFHLENRLIGCLYCPESNITQLALPFSYRWAFKTAFRAINSPSSGFNGVVFLRTFAPSHFEGGEWYTGGDCMRTVPFKRNETELQDWSKEMYLAQMEELRIAENAGNGTGGKFKAMDVTKAMLLRPDGHPRIYGHWPDANRTFYNDCVHWCLPGPIDSWNDFLQEMIRREIRGF